MNSADLLADAFGRIQEEVHDAVGGLTPAELAERPDPAANSVGWLIWHLTRVQDDHVADAAGDDQIWTSQGWYDRFGLPFPPEAIGYGFGPDEVAAVEIADPSLLTGYYDAVHERTIAYVADLSDADLDRIVDKRWNPPVSLGVRLVSVIGDDLQHVGQAAYLRGLLLRRR
ncbi:DinB family protein [Streptomyces sp. NBC_01476]|uniref:mycothiol transferase n=1 Tax=Streptomyces sp. NBC_01476 TaxID=2903881 RepID=UPI002E330E12|nr:DinB family protein [Streptomyces sp. NBC_01476]